MDAQLNLNFIFVKENILKFINKHQEIMVQKGILSQIKLFVIIHQENDIIK